MLKNLKNSLSILILIGIFGIVNVNTYIPYLYFLLLFIILCFIIGMLIWCKKNKKYPFYIFLLIPLFSLSSYAQTPDLCSNIINADLGECPALEKINNNIQQTYLELGSQNTAISSVIRNLVFLEGKYNPSEVTYDQATFDKVGQVIDMCKKVDLINDCPNAIDKCLEAQNCHNHIAEIKNRTTAEIPSFNELLAIRKNNCAICTLGCIFIGAAGEVVEKSYQSFETKALKILAIAFLFWIAIQTLTLFSQWGLGKNVEFLQNLIKQSFLVIITAILLSVGISSIFKYALSPLVNVTTIIANKIITSGLTSFNSNPSLINLQEDFATKLGLPQADEGYCSYCSPDNTIPACPSTSSFNYALSYKSIDRLICMICRLNRSFDPYQVLGSQLIAYTTMPKGRQEEKTTEIAGATFEFPEPVGYFILGCAFALTFWYLQIRIGLELIHIFFKFVLVTILMPFFILLFAFKSTRSYTKKGWNLFVLALFEIISLSISILLVLVLMLCVIPTQNVINNLATLLNNSGNSPTMEEIYQTLVTTGDNSIETSSIAIILVSLFLIASIASVIIGYVQNIAKAIMSININLSSLSNSLLDLATTSSRQVQNFFNLIKK